MRSNTHFILSETSSGIMSLTDLGAGTKAVAEAMAAAKMRKDLNMVELSWLNGEKWGCSGVLVRREGGSPLWPP